MDYGSEIKQLKKMVFNFIADYPTADKKQLQDFFELAVEEIEDTSFSRAVEMLSSDLKDYGKEIDRRDEKHGLYGSKVDPAN